MIDYENETNINMNISFTKKRKKEINIYIVEVSDGEMKVEWIKGKKYITNGVKQKIIKKNEKRNKEKGTISVHNIEEGKIDIMSDK